MPIEIDWEVTDAPDDEARPGVPPPPRTPKQPPAGGDGQRGGPQSHPSSRFGRRLALALIIAGLAASGLWYVTRAGWQRVSADVVALVHYEEQYAAAGDTQVVLTVQDHSNTEWIAVRMDEVAANLAAPLPVPKLRPLDRPIGVGPVLAGPDNWVRADVTRRYQTPDGQIVAFTLPQFYRQRGSTDWQRTKVPDAYWGTWRDWQAEHLRVRYSDRDQTLVEQIGPQVDRLLAQACSLWGQLCASLPPARLYLSSFVGSLEYDPLLNVRVRVEYGDTAGRTLLPSDYFISVPSPQMAGVPADDTTRRYFAEYLAVRLIASLADSAVASRDQARALTSKAVGRLGLSHADPGYALGPGGPVGEAAIRPGLSPVAPIRPGSSHTVDFADALPPFATPAVIVRPSKVSFGLIPVAD